MSFDVDGRAYDRFMGRYSSQLAPAFADFAGVRPDQDEVVLDVGCGTGALTSELVRRLGPGRVSAVDPSAPFVAIAADRLPGVEIRTASVEALPYQDDMFDVSVAQLVVHFMHDPILGIAEMVRVTRPEGVVAACVWDYEGERSPISVFWRAARDVMGEVEGEADLPGARAGHLGRLFREAGVSHVVEGEVAAHVEHADFEEWWAPFTLGVGPAGDYVRGLPDAGLAEIRARCHALLGDGPVRIVSAAWAVRGSAARR